MCRIGDLIVIEEFYDELGNKDSRHSFVVLNDKKGKIEGVNYEFV